MGDKEYHRQSSSQLLRNLGFVLDPKAMEMIPMEATITAVAVEAVTFPDDDRVGTQAIIRFVHHDLRHRLDLTMDPAEPGTQFKLRRDLD